MPDVKQITAKIEPVIENVSEAIATHPRSSLAIAATLGVALGWFIKRS